MAGIGCPTWDFLSRKQAGRKAKAPFLGVALTKTVFYSGKEIAKNAL
jgi:hypothetical protein